MSSCHICAKLLCRDEVHDGIRQLLPYWCAGFACLVNDRRSPPGKPLDAPCPFYEARPEPEKQKAPG